MARLLTSSPLPSGTAYFHPPTRFSRRAWCCFTRKFYIVREEGRRRAAPVMPINFDSLQRRRSSPWLECRSREGSSSSREAEAANSQNEPRGYGDEYLEEDKNLITLPTILTLGRVAAIPILLVGMPFFPLERFLVECFPHSVCTYFLLPALFCVPACAADFLYLIYNVWIYLANVCKEQTQDIFEC